MNQQHFFVTSKTSQGQKFFHIKFAYPGLSEGQIAMIAQKMQKFPEKDDGQEFIRSFRSDVLAKCANGCIVVDIHECTPLNSTS